MPSPYRSFVIQKSSIPTNPLSDWAPPPRIVYRGIYVHFNAEISLLGKYLIDCQNANWLATMMIDNGDSSFKTRQFNQLSMKPYNDEVSPPKTADTFDGCVDQLHKNNQNVDNIYYHDDERWLVKLSEHEYFRDGNCSIKPGEFHQLKPIVDMLVNYER